MMTAAKVYPGRAAGEGRESSTSLNQLDTGLRWCDDLIGVSPS